MVVWNLNRDKSKCFGIGEQMNASRNLMKTQHIAHFRRSVITVELPTQNQVVEVDNT